MELARRSARVATAPKGSEFTLGAACHQRYHSHRPAPACSDRSGDFGDFDGQGLISLGGRGAVRSRGGGDRRAARGTMRRVCQAREPRDQARSVAPGNAADGLVHGAPSGRVRQHPAHPGPGGLPRPSPLRAGRKRWRRSERRLLRRSPCSHHRLGACSSMRVASVFGRVIHPVESSSTQYRTFLTRL